MPHFDPISTRERFESKHEKGEGCWNWTAGKRSTGYGQMRVGKKSELAHRLAWQYAYGPIPDGLCVLHRCDNRACVRPDHLFLGDRAENNRDTHAKGRWHYVPPGQGQRKREDPLQRRGPRASSIPERFWSKVDTRGGDAEKCWPWLASLWRTGYGRFFLPGRAKSRNRAYAHRIAYELHYGAIPDGMLVMHTCDNRACCNPAHLKLGTHADNMLDRDMKGRQANQKGAANGNARLSEADVRKIKRLVKSGMSQMKIAALFGIRQPHVSRIVRGTAWNS